MILFFTIAVFISSFLLFWCQPLLGKLLLPILGGTPSVWITSMFFFQLLLLAGYLYAHLLTKWLHGWRQRGIHLILLAGATIVLPFHLPRNWMQSLPQETDPILWLLGILLVTAGPPFLFLSASAPLLQKWFSQSGHKAAPDPYFLYSSSNLGSLAALLGYPLLMEPRFTIHHQSVFWMIGYFVLLLFFLSLPFLFRTAAPVGDRPIPVPPPESPPQRDRRKETAERFRWTFSAFIPSSLMLGITSFLTSDIASFPLLWIVPLAIYLITYILAFSRKPSIPVSLMLRLLPGVSLLLTFTLLTEIRTPVWFLFLIALLFLFIAAMALHGQLAELRPKPERLTEYYLYISIGGAMGGLFNGVLAPLLFEGVTELPLVLVVMFLLLQKREAPSPGKSLGKDLLFPLLIGLWTTAMAILIPRLTLEPYQLWMFVLFGLPLIVSYTFLHHPRRFGLALGAIFVASTFFHAISGQIIHTGRNFFGTFKIARHPEGPTLRFFHGTTLHGMQFTDPAHRGEPLAYFHRTGPFGQIMTAFQSRFPTASIGVIGIGIGSMLAYSRPSERWIYFEIDPEIIHLARNPRYFTFFSNAKAAQVDAIAGDARLTLERQTDESFQLLILDAFSSDVVPTHLLTREAFALYLRKLAPGGMIAAHISSQNLDLAPIVGNVAASLNLVGLHRKDDQIFFNGRAIPGKLPSSWVVLSRSRDHLGTLPGDPNWMLLKSDGKRWWTDEYSNVVSVLKWF